MSENLSTSPTVPWHLDRGRRAGEMGYLPGLDGIRALAIIGVLLYHADLDPVPGGFLGVDVFFVLSGFLITSLILEQFDRTGRVDFGRFYLGRARRLLPALFLVLIVCAILVVTIYQDAAYQFARDALASFFYVNNWHYIVAEQSYFEFIGRPPLLQHLWSLAVEEQFYLIWPAIAYLVVKRFARRGVMVLALILAVVSTAWMISLSLRNGYPDLADPSRAYFGTDSHVMGLLIGAALATFWRPGLLPKVIPTGARNALTGVGAAALLTVIAFFLFVGEYTSWLYRGGFLALSIIVAVLIAMATHPALPLGRAIGTQPWRYIGQRSYGLYLWHWPVFMLTRPMLDLPIDGIALFMLRMAITFGVAELSFRFVEMPIRRGAIDRWVTRMRTASPEDRSWLRMGTAAGAALAATGIFILFAALVTAPQPTAQQGLASDVAEAIGVASGGPSEVALDDPTTAPQPGTSAAPPASATAANRGRLSAIGDSVMLGARNTLKDVIPGTRVDAAVARYPGAFLGRLKRYVRNGTLAPVVVLHPGTNGVLPESMMREMLDIVADSPRVVVVNDSMPRKWRKPNNTVIASVVPDYPNAVLVDWYALSKDHPEFFVSDGIHLTPKGARAYARAIKEAAGL